MTQREQAIATIEAMLNLMPLNDIKALLEEYGYTDKDATTAVILCALDQKGRPFANDLFKVFKKWLDSADGTLQVLAIQEAVKEAALNGQLETNAANGNFDWGKFATGEGEGDGLLDYLNWGTGTIISVWGKADGTDATRAETERTKEESNLIVQKYKSWFLAGIILIILAVIFVAGYAIVKATKK